MNAGVAKMGTKNWDKIGSESNGLGFWHDRRPCWEMCHCPEKIRNECPAMKYTRFPCWEIEGTYLKLSEDRQTGTDTSLCQVCRVYKRYGGNQPIVLKLLGKGIDSYLRNLDSPVKPVPDISH
jgi:hypothetical protein